MEIRQIGDFEIDRCVEDDGYIIIDLRDREEYDYNRIKGAVNVPFEDFDMYLNENNFEGRKIIILSLLYIGSFIFFIIITLFIIPLFY